MKQIALVIIFVALLFETSFAFDCPKCKVEMTEKANSYVCPKCGNTIEVVRTKVYPSQPTPQEKPPPQKIKEEQPKWGYEEKIGLIKKLERKIEIGKEELRKIETELSKNPEPSRREWLLKAKKTYEDGIKLDERLISEVKRSL
jgi:uncharacterized Zn finger protein (UPF0148 family)